MTRSADWRVFSIELEGVLADRDSEEMAPMEVELGIDHRVAMLTGAITEAASASLRRQRGEYVRSHGGHRP